MAMFLIAEKDWKLQLNGEMVRSVGLCLLIKYYAAFK
jgi:hypothetical protein